MVIVDKVGRTFKNGNVEVLKNISFVVRQGEAVGIIGKNGAGKTTLLKLIAGVLSPTEGHVWTLGKNPCHTIGSLRPEIACIFSGNNQLLSGQNVKEMLDRQKEVYHISDEKYKRVLSEICKMFDLKKYLDRSFSKLSVGQKRCVELIIAVLQLPALLILDEPTIGLDEENKEIFCKIVNSLRKDYGMTIIISSHDLESLSVSSDRVLLLQDGRLSFDGDWELLKERGSVWRKASFVTQLLIDMEDLPIQHLAYENGKMELEFNLRQITEEALKVFLEERGEIKDFRVEDPPIEVLVCRLLQGGDLLWAD